MASRMCAITLPIRESISIDWARANAKLRGKYFAFGRVFFIVHHRSIDAAFTRKESWLNSWQKFHDSFERMNVNCELRIRIPPEYSERTRKRNNF